MIRWFLRRIWHILILLCVGFVALKIWQGYQAENNMQTVSYTQVQQAQQNHQSIFFYSNVCPHCQAIFPILYLENAMFHNIYFVNLHANYALAQQLNITQVPTFETNNGSYTGNNVGTMLKMAWQS